jgi:anthranilate phosphoribosyltransferase
MSDLKPFIGKIATGETLSRDEARQAFDIMMSGEATPSQIGGFLMGLRVRGETIEEITGAVLSMRARMTRVEAPEGAVDIVGTGGDGAKTYNISTCSALVTAACGVKVAKHGNRALSSRSGAADALAALGVNIEANPATIARCINEAGVGFMFAPAHHAAMRHVGPTRVELGTRTIFNVLGPMANPAGVKRQVIGVYHRDLVEPIAHVMRNLGAERIWVTHGADGLDEVTTTGVTYVAELRDGEIRSFEITPEDAGIRRASIDDLRGGSAEENADAIRRVLAGQPGPFRDVVLLTSAVALVVADAAPSLKEGVAKAAEAIDNGSAASVLERLVFISNGQD